MDKSLPISKANLIGKIISKIVSIFKKQKKVKFEVEVLSKDTINKNSRIYHIQLKEGEKIFNKIVTSHGIKHE